MAETNLIRTPDQRLRVFVSSSLRELAAERQAVRQAIAGLRLAPVMFELGARPHPPQSVYRAYLGQSQIFVGIYWQTYGWAAPGEQISGLEDEYLLSAGLPRLVYVKSPAPEREPRLADMLGRIKDAGDLSYRQFSDPAELRQLVADDLALLLSERFETAESRVHADTPDSAVEEEAPSPPVLPVATTSLIGRDREAVAVQSLVTNHGARLVTLTGPGGIGKSRLALEVAQRLEPMLDDGVRFADLSSVSAAELVANAIAAALPVNTSGARLTRDLKSYLRTRRLLLVLDNFEHIMAAAPLVAELLAAAPGLVVLVTSRTVLRLSGEHEFPVPALAVPDAGAVADAMTLGRYPAVRLFAERAHAVAPGFELTSANAGAVAEICRQLDGLPLAIELAAAKSKLLAPQALLSRLGNTMSLLTGGARDLPARQQTLKNTLDWSFGLLSPGEQALFARLGVFTGTFDLMALEAVGDNRRAPATAGPDPAGQIIDTLGSLVDNSLVMRQTLGAELRFRLLATIREYALERLHASDDAWREGHDRHAAYFAALAEPDVAELQGPAQLAWLRRLEAEHGNLVAMMSWLVDQNQLDTTVRLVWATWRFWWLRGHTDDLAHIMNGVLAKSGRLASYERALSLAASGFVRFTDGDQDGAQLLFERSLPLFQQAGDKVRTALTAGMLGHLLALQHQDVGATSMFDESQKLLRELDNYELVGHDRVQHQLNTAFLYNFLGQIRLGERDSQAAAELFTQGLSAARYAQDRFTILLLLYDLGVSSEAQGDLSGAAAYLSEGLSLAAEARDEASAAHYLERLAVIASLQDDAQRAVHLLAAASALLETKGSGWLSAFLPHGSHSDETVTALRSRLGDPAFQAAWTYGRSIGGQRAVEYALNGGRTSTPHHDSVKPEAAQSATTMTGRSSQTVSLPGAAQGEKRT